jgi:AAA+ superfamily predicted ATPase
MQTGSPLSQIRRIFHKASRSSAPTVLFIDECDKLFYDRDILKGMELSGYGRTGYAHALIDLFLSMTGGGSDKITVLLATNNISLFDPALLNRMDYQIKLEFPSLEARTKLIKTYVDLKMKKEDVAIFTDAKIHEIAVLIEGFSGRRIEMLVGRILRKQQLNLGVSLTESMINQVVHECLKEFKDLERAIKEGREGKGDAKSKSDDAAQ